MSSGRRSREAIFTVTQWEELEHQALIFKYMVSGLPIPPHLISTLTTARSFVHDFSHSSIPPNHHTLGWGCYHQMGMGMGMGMGRKVGDAEPGRCRRTDGKKWRCAKEVFPDSKYCERHMHRGRHRSRKPVEHQHQQQQQQLITTTTTTTTTTPTSSTNPPLLYHHNTTTTPQYHPFLYPPQSSSSRPPPHPPASFLSPQTSSYHHSSSDIIASYSPHHQPYKDYRYMRDGSGGTQMSDTPLTMSSSGSSSRCSDLSFESLGGDHHTTNHHHHHQKQQQRYNNGDREDRTQNQMPFHHFLGDWQPPPPPPPTAHTRDSPCSSSDG